MQHLTVSAPGSIMIAGEHAVVYGHRAIVCAIDQRITLRIETLTRPVLEIESGIAPPLSVPMDDLPLDGPYRFILRAVQPVAARLGGLRVSVSSAIDPTLGLGSSAAITVAMLAALDRITGDDADQGELHAQALAIVRAVQGRGSGADLAASLCGGLIAYREGDIRPLPAPPPLSLAYAGYKTPTAEVLARVAERMKGREAAFADLYARIGDVTEQAIAAASGKDWAAFGQHLAANQTLMEELGVSDPILDSLIRDAQGTEGLLAAKISGSGLGDCVVAVGACPLGFVPAPASMTGVEFHE